MAASTPRPEQPQYTVLLVSSGDMRAAALRAVLAQEPTVALVGEAALPDLARRMSSLQPDLVAVVDDHHEDVVLRVAQELNRVASRAKLLVLVDGVDYGLLRALLRLRVASLVIWDQVNPRSLHVLLRALVEGGWFVASPEAVEELVLPPGRHHGARAELPPLTANERILLEGLVRGASVKELARRINRTTRTVDRMFDELERTLDARNRPHLAVLAFRHGFGEEDGAP